MNYTFLNDSDGSVNESHSSLEYHLYNITGPYPGSLTRAVVLILFAFIGILFNSFLLVAIVPNRRLHTVTNVLVCHLAVLGLLSCVLLLPVHSAGSFLGTLPDSDIFCLVHGHLSSIITMVTTWTLSALGWDKYQTIASPLHYTTIPSAKRMTLWLASMWTFSVTVSLISFARGNIYAFDDVKSTCGLVFKETSNMWYSLSFTVVAFVIPMTILIYCYSHIFRIAQSQSRRIATIVLVSLSVHAPVIAHSKTSTTFKGRKATMTIVQLLGAFVILYVPFMLLYLFEILAYQKFPVDEVSVTITTLFQSAPVINAFVYGIRNRLFREAFVAYVRRKCHEYSSRKQKRCIPYNVRSQYKPPGARALPREVVESGYPSTLLRGPDDIIRVIPDMASEMEAPKKQLQLTRSKSLDLQENGLASGGASLLLMTYDANCIKKYKSAPIFLDNDISENSESEADKLDEFLATVPMVNCTESNTYYNCR